jgi:hypothetical protein
LEPAVQLAERELRLLLRLLILIFFGWMLLLLLQKLSRSSELS